MRRSLAMGVILVGLSLGGPAWGHWDIWNWDFAQPDYAPPADLGFCSAACPACPAGEVCGRQIHAGLAPTCLPRCISDEGCASGNCLDLMQPDGTFRRQPVCLPPLPTWCVPPPACSVAGLKDACADRATLMTPTPRIDVCAYEFLSCDLGCEVTANGARCALPPDMSAPPDLVRKPRDLTVPPDRAVPRDLRVSLDLRLPPDLEPELRLADQPGCSCSLSPTATTGLNLAGIAVGLCLLGLLLRRGKG